eukprot:TRINITY_DN597_c0_g2_i10.p1 TRINITY_DN597_c0_g2~~TRINITY_DN597_c0_g2_i10.p1  ORF type:complete len:877 (+),score=349.05 TRINITY_DN597_c0_g2_i10:674-3304(+)
MRTIGRKQLKKGSYKSEISAYAYDIIDTFFNALPNACTHEELLQHLITRFVGPLEKDENTIKLWTEIHETVTFNVLYMIKRWLDIRPWDWWEQDKKLNTLLLNFLNTIEDSNYPASSLKIELQKVERMIEQNDIPYHVFKWEKNNSTNINAGLIDVDKLANQLTLLEFEIAQRIRCDEYLKQRWNKSGKEQAAAQLLFAIDWFNKISAWFCTIVVKESSPASRAQIIQYLIVLANKLLALNNFNGVMEVLSALHNTAIDRLKQSWAMIPSKEQEEFERLSKLMAPKNNYKDYRTAFAEAKPPFVAFFGVFLIDFTFLDDCKPDFEENLINFDKVRIFGEKILDMMRFKDAPYNIQPDNEIRNQILNCEAWNLNEIFRLSKLSEDSGSTVRKQKGKVSYTKYFANMEVTGQEKVSTKESKLTERDWQLLQSNLKLSTSEKDSIILQNGIECEAIYKIKSGSIRVEDSNGEIKILTADNSFGEIYYLGVIPCQIRLKCEEKTEYYIIPFDVLSRQLMLQSNFAKRFFRNLALLYAQELRNQTARKAGQTTTTTTTTATNPKLKTTSTEEQPKDLNTSQRRVTNTRNTKGKAAQQELTEEDEKSKLIKRINNTDEDLIQDLPATLIKKFNTHGTLFIFPSRMIFFSKVFSLETKEILVFSNIKNKSSKKQNDLIFESTDGKAKQWIFRIKDECNEIEYINLLISKAQDLNDSKPNDKNRFGTLSRNSTLSTNSTTQSSANTIQQQINQAEELTNQALTEEDWAMLLKGANVCKFTKDQIIINEGQQYQRLFHLTKGRCRVERTGNKLGTMKEKETFGEISFLEGSGAAVTVIADEDEIELQIIEGYFVNRLFNLRDGIEGRFYHYLSTILARRLLAGRQ